MSAGQPAQLVGKFSAVIEALQLAPLRLQKPTQVETQGISKRGIQPPGVPPLREIGPRMVDK